MPSPVDIAILQLARLIGLPGAPALVDLRVDDPTHLLPAARRMPVLSRAGGGRRRMAASACSTA